MMNILILGLGSIGQRHLRNLKELDKRINIFAYRKKFNTPSLNNNNKVLNSNLKKKYNISYIKNLSEIKKLKINCAFICTPSSHHAKEASFLIKNNISCFIEKPVATNFSQINQLSKIVKIKPNVPTMVGYQLKFNPIIHYLEKIINREKSIIGKILNVDISHGEHIDDFHTYETYKGSYAAVKKLGGGVILSQIHEIDYFLSFFQKYKIIKSNSLCSKVSDLEIDVEDLFTSSFLLENKKKNKIICNLTLNYFERPKRRQIRIIGTKGSLLACLNKQKIEIFKNNKTQILKFRYKKNDIFKKQINFFLDHVKKHKKVPKKYNILNGLATAAFALQLKNKSFR